MATLSNFNEAVSVVAGVDLGEVRLLSRNLREAGLIPQRGRGLHAAHLEACHIARLLLGLLVAGQLGPLHKVASKVVEIGNLRKKDPLKMTPYSDSPRSVPLLPGESTFLEALTRVIVAFTQSENALSWHGLVEFVGIEFGGGRAYPWIQLKRDHRELIGLTSDATRRCAFGSASLLHRVQTAGMVSDSKISNGVLLEIARLLRTDANLIGAYIGSLKKKHTR